MAARLTDKQKKKILAVYMEVGSYNATAKRFGVSESTVRRLCKREPDLIKKAEEKREQNTLDMLAYMDSRKEQAQGVIDSYLKALADPEKLEEATLSQIATALGIVVDKFTKNIPVGANSMEEQLKNRDALAEIIMNPVSNRNIEDYE